MKFKFIKANRTNLYEQMDGLDVQRLRTYLSRFKEGTKLEMIVREEINWDVGKMRRFFEGPVCTHIKNLYAERGIAVGKGIIREALKTRFIGCNTDAGLVIPESSTTLDFKKFTEFLKDIDNWCMDEFGCGLPEPDTSDLGE